MSIFKTYDIRGIAGQELTAAVVIKIARVLYADFGFKQVSVGYDKRECSSILAYAFKKAFPGDICSLGLCSTEEVYYSAATNDVDLGVMFTASHNPKEYGGIKFILRDGVPFPPEMLRKLEKFVEGSRIEEEYDPKFSYMSCAIGETNWKPSKDLIVINCTGGTAAGLLKELKGTNFLLLNPDTCPHNPDPTDKNVRAETAAVVRAEKAAYGVIFDGDNDRFTVLDPNGSVIEGYYLGGLLMEHLANTKGISKVVHDSNLYWNTLEIAKKKNIQVLKSKTGHVLMKQAMRSFDGDYGFEYSGHNYFKFFFYCDSGIIPFLLFDQISNKFERLAEMRKAFPCSEPISLNTKVNFAENVSTLMDIYKNPISMDTSEGLAMEFPEWRFTLRQSCTEPKLRLAIESRGNINLVQEKIEEFKEILL